jgi:flagellar hook-length control protein FliK
MGQEYAVGFCRRAVTPQGYLEDIMDIIASLTSPSVAPTQVGDLSAASTPEAGGASFSDALSKASEPVAAQAPTSIKVPQVTAAQTSAAAKAPAVSQAVDGSAVEAEPTQALSLVQRPDNERVMTDPVEQPTPALTTRPVTPLNQQAAGLEDAATDDSPAVDISPVPDELAQDADALSPDSTDDSSLQDIRQRMALIENAGQLDMASMVVIPLPAPLQITATVTGSSDVLSDAQQAPDDAVTLLGTDLATSGLTPAAPGAAADEQVSTLLDPANTVQTLAGSFDGTLQDQGKQSDGTLVDNTPDSSTNSGPQGSFTLAALNLNTASLSSTATTTGDSPLLSATIGTSSWQDGLGQQVIDMLKRGEKQVDLRLHPADLGPLSISLNLSDSNTQAQFQSAHASVRAAVEQALPQLREALASQGITLGQASVGDNSSRSSGQPQRDTSADNSGSLITAGETPQVMDEPIVQSLIVSNGGVDLYL